MAWHPHQRECLREMGLQPMSLRGASAVEVPSVAGASAALLRHLLRAARLDDASRLPPYPAAWTADGKRAYWRRLRTLRVGMR